MTHTAHAAAIPAQEYTKEWRLGYSKAPIQKESGFPKTEQQGLVPRLMSSPPKLREPEANVRLAYTALCS